MFKGLNSDIDKRLYQCSVENIEVYKSNELSPTLNFLLCDRHKSRPEIQKEMGV